MSQGDAACVIVANLKDKSVHSKCAGNDVFQEDDEVLRRLARTATYLNQSLLCSLQSNDRTVARPRHKETQEMQYNGILEKNLHESDHLFRAHSFLAIRGG
jgi:hypothetical protein